MKKKIKNLLKEKFKFNEVSALINGLNYRFIGNRIFTDFGVEIK